MGKVELHLEIDAELLAEAAERGVVLDRALEDGVRTASADSDRRRPADARAAAKRQRGSPAEAEAAARKWAKENADAIRVHNERVETRGVWGEDLRRW